MEREVLQLLGFELVNFTAFDIVLSIIRQWKDIAAKENVDDDMDLECSELILDQVFEQNLLALLDLVKLDLQSSTF